jgi:glycerate kinase
MARIVIALDSFKGTCSAVDAVAALAHGWNSARPKDIVLTVPFADGGEGTLDCYRAAIPQSTLEVVLENEAEPPIEWLNLGDGRAVVELARICGLGFTGTKSPETASTRRVGIAIDAAVRAGCGQIIVALGGSGSTDGGAGILVELGVLLLDDNGIAVADGNLGIGDVVAVDQSAAKLPPSTTLTMLTDVTNPLCGPRGAARVFGPQKGATAQQVSRMDNRLASFARCFPELDPSTPGAGAAGGAAFGLLALGGTIQPGAQTVADMLNVGALIASADLVILGEGRFDSQSLDGKAVGVLSAMARAADIPAWLVAGAVEDAETHFPQIRELATLAPTLDSAMAEPQHWLDRAGQELALAFEQREHSQNSSTPTG